MYSPAVTFSVIAAPLVVPMPFVAKHTYIPSSSVVTLLIFREGERFDEPEYLKSSITTPVPFFFQNTVDATGREESEQLKVTGCPNSMLYAISSTDIEGISEMNLNTDWSLDFSYFHIHRIVMRLCYGVC